MRIKALKNLAMQPRRIMLRKGSSGTRLFLIRSLAINYPARLGIENPQQRNGRPSDPRAPEAHSYLSGGHWAELR